VSGWPQTARKLTYRWCSPHQDAFTSPAVELTCVFDPAAFAEREHLEWALETALHHLREALDTELKGDTRVYTDQEGSS
jgi:hypothetical protein